MADVTDRRPSLYVSCAGPEDEALWRARANQVPRVRVVPFPDGDGVEAFVNEVIATSADDVCIFAHGRALLGAGFDARALALAARLDEAAPNAWGCVSNCGQSADGRNAYDFGRPGSPLARVSGPVAASFVIGPVTLLNLRALRQAGVTLPALKAGMAFPGVLSLACHRGPSPLPCFVDSALFCVREERLLADAIAFYRTSAAFHAWWKGAFVNHQLATPLGPVALGEHVDYRYLDLQGLDEAPSRADLLSVARRLTLSLAEARGHSLTIACRTLFRRPALLTRAVRSFAVAAARVPRMRVEVLLLTTRTDVDDADALVACLRDEHPGLSVRLRIVVDEKRPSRTAAMREAFSVADTDYVWLVDDDDFVVADAIENIAARMPLFPGPVIVGDSVVLRETWGPDDAPTQVEAWRPVKRYFGSDYLLCLGGSNHLPICSFIFATTVIKAQSEHALAIGDYNEDYFFICLALSAPQGEVRVVDGLIACISLHGMGNAVTEEDRTKWHWDYATFAGELMALPQAGSPLLWDLAARYLPPEAGVSTEVATLRVFSSDARGEFLPNPRCNAFPVDGADFSLHVRLPASEGKVFRLDVGRVGGIVEITSLVLECDGVEGSLRLPGDSPVLVAGEGAQALALGGGGALRFVVLGPSPKLLLRWDGWTGGREGSLKISLRFKALPEMEAFLSPFPGRADGGRPSPQRVSDLAARSEHLSAIERSWLYLRMPGVRIFVPRAEKP